MERKLTNSSNKLLELKSKFNKDKVKKVLKGSREKDGLIKQIIVYALLICIGFVYLYPILYMISNSLMNLEDLLDTSINWIPSKLYLDNYKKAALNMNYIGTFFQSIIVAGVPTILNVVVCSFVGYGFARFEFRGKKILMALLIFSYIIPPQITMMPTYVLYADLKLIGTLWSFVLPALFGQGLNAPIFILIFYQFFKQVPKVLIEAAQIDGAGFFRSFFRISIPSAVPAIITVFLFSLVWYWNESYLTQLYVNGVFSNGNWTTLIVELKKFDMTYNPQMAMVVDGASSNNNESIRMAATMLSILPVLAMYFVLQRYFVESIDRTGITGE
ncbi:MAG TPA: carbohydrate ABC transporter permease [Clostridiales bacterium]|nr:carbohydrate ABC transporter permease [Clostridiales bacterium]